MPLVLFPGWFGVLARALPWASYLQAPADLWLGKEQGWGVLGVLALQALWAVVLLAGCRAAARRGRAQGGGPGWLRPLTRYVQISALWVRASRAYPVSWWMLVVGGFLITGVEFVGIWILFQNVDDLGGFTLQEVAFLYGGSGIAFAVADLFVGRIERLGQMIRLGKLDQMMVRPVPLLIQVCADEFALRRLSRIAQAALVLGWALRLRRLDGVTRAPHHPDARSQRR